jgi:lauroyl/myristoyl acyltransferase
MLDCFYGTNSCLYTDFLGKPAASLGTLYGLAQRAGAIVVPTASIQRGGKQMLDIGELIDLRSTSIEEAGQRVNDYFSSLVRTYPDQWMGWQNLLTRWNMARI